MGAQFGIVLPLWSYAADHGDLLERVAGEVGLDHVTVPAVSGPQTQFRLGCDREKPYFHTEGGWHFPPNVKAYAAAGVRPTKARWAAATDLLARLREHVGRRGLRMVLRVDLRGVPALVEHEPHLCQRNAWGQEVSSAGACACNPALRELLRATLEDLGRYEPAAYEVVAWFPDHAADGSGVRPLGWHRPTRRLLDICFCASCRQIAERAGLDADQAARSARVLVERHVAGPETDGGSDPVLDGYVEARGADSVLWLRRLAEADAGRRYCLAHGFADVVSLADCAPLERLMSLTPHYGTAVSGEVLESVVRLLEITKAEGLAVWPWRPSFESAADLVRLVSETARGGVKAFDFEGLDEALPEAVTWLKQAVRFARRG
jgi:hypothetical protein